MIDSKYNTKRKGVVRYEQKDLVVLDNTCETINESLGKFGEKFLSEKLRLSRKKKSNKTNGIRKSKKEVVIKVFKATACWNVAQSDFNRKIEPIIKNYEPISGQACEFLDKCEQLMGVANNFAKIEFTLDSTIAKLDEIPVANETERSIRKAEIVKIQCMLEKMDKLKQSLQHFIKT
jgi:hypothetical protein